MTRNLRALLGCWGALVALGAVTLVAGVSLPQPSVWGVPRSNPLHVSRPSTHLETVTVAAGVSLQQPSAWGVPRSNPLHVSRPSTPLETVTVAAGVSPQQPSARGVAPSNPLHVSRPPTPPTPQQEPPKPPPEQKIHINNSSSVRPAERKLSSPEVQGELQRLQERHLGPDLLVWREEFDSLDLGVWEHMVTAWRGGNKEFQYYRNSRRNSFVRDGVLHIQPTLTAEEFGEEFLYNGSLAQPGCNHKPCISESGQDVVLPVLSARMRTQRSFGFRYGRVEVRAQLPRGDWLWPAIWMKPVHNSYGGWPASGEIDLVEARGNRRLRTAKGVSMGIDRMSSTLHYGPNASYNIWRPTHWEMSLEGSGSDFSSDFHLFGMEWTQHSITFTLDNEVTGHVSPPTGGFWKIGGFDKDPGGRNIWENGEYLAPFDREFFFVLNVAVGGTFFPDGWRNEPYSRPWSWASKHVLRDFWERRKWWLPTWQAPHSALKVDYIRVFTLPSP